MSNPPAAAAATSSTERKTARVLEFLKPLLRSHFGTSYDLSLIQASSSRPFFVGVNGVQGSGKTTLVRRVADTLWREYEIRTAVLSIDDLYLPHDQQQELARQHPENPLIQHRGQPGTHDVGLGVDLFNSLKHSDRTQIPAYDKSAFNGEGDRVPKDRWEVVNDDPESKHIKVVIFEGWCVGFRPLERAQVVAKWQEAVEERKTTAQYSGRLGWNELENVEFINERLRDYDQLTDSFDALVHIDCADTLWVYDWRLEQERELLKTKGSGMTSEQVKKFVDGYYPAYELFYEKLRQGIFAEPGRQLRLIVGKDRAIQNVLQI